MCDVAFGGAAAGSEIVAVYVALIQLEAEICFMAYGENLAGNPFCIMLCETEWGYA